MGSALDALPQATLIVRPAALAVSVLCGFAPRATGQDVVHPVIPALTWRPVAIGAGVVGLALFFDAQIAREVQARATPGSLQTATTLNHFGEPVVFVPVIGGLALAGVVAHRPAITRTAARTAGAIILASVITQGGKFIVGRSRPFQDPDLDADDFAPFSGRTSFPSGHTTAAFALATSLGDASENTLARIGLYALATGTAYGRISASEHWLSDVLAGAGIGILSAKFASGKIRIFGLQAPRALIGPHGGTLSWTVDLPPTR